MVKFGKTRRPITDNDLATICSCVIAPPDRFTAVTAALTAFPPFTRRFPPPVEGEAFLEAASVLSRALYISGVIIGSFLSIKSTSLSTRASPIRPKPPIIPSAIDMNLLAIQYRHVDIRIKDGIITVGRRETMLREAVPDVTIDSNTKPPDCSFSI